MFMFTVLSLTTTESNIVLWKEPSPASPYSCRPVSLMLGKETAAELKPYYKELLTDKRAALLLVPLPVLYKGKLYNVHIKPKMSLIDGKMRALLNGCGGAFCQLCTCTRDDAIDLEMHFEINRSGDQTNEIWRQLCSGEMVKKPHDQAVRMGVTREPIVAFEDVAMISPLHCNFRFFDTLMKIIYHLNAGIFVWSDDKNVLGSGYESLKISKGNIRKTLKEQTHLAVDMPDATGKGGTSTTGNVIHSMLSREKNLSVLVSQVPEEYQEKMHDCLSRSYVITKLYNSTFKINVPLFKDFCKHTKELLLTSFNELDGESWIYLTPTVHGILEHSPELIEANGSKGLGDFTESSLECNNKILRLIRIAQSRKCNQVDNLSDCINRLWIRSDINVRNAVPPKKTLQKVSILNSKENSRCSLPFQSLADYYIKELIIENTDH